MLHYKAPIIDIKCLIEDVFNDYPHYENSQNPLKRYLI